MPLAFEVTETMTGRHHFVVPALGDADERPCWFRITWGNAFGATLRGALARRPITLPFRGVVCVEGLTEGEAPCEGTLTLDYVAAHRLRYDLAFEAKGERYTLRADKVDVHLARPVALIKTHTTAYLEVRDAAAKVVSRGVLHFRPESLASFVRSGRVVRG